MINRQVSEKRCRLFVGVVFPRHIVEETQRIQQEIKQRSLFKGRWTNPENLHLTLKFIGEVTSEKLPKIEGLLTDVQTKPIVSRLGKLGVFSAKRDIRIIWIHVEGNELTKLQKRIDLALSDLLPIEQRFMSHLTIARVKSVENRARLIDALDSIKTVSVEFTIEKFLLIRSQLTPDGPLYTELASFPCAR